MFNMIVVNTNSYIYYTLYYSYYTIIKMNIFMDGERESRYIYEYLSQATFSGMQI